MARNRSRRVLLITGGAGFVGSHLCERLLGEGHRVIALDNLSTGTTDNLAFAEDDPRFDLVVGDVTDSSLVAGLAGSADSVFHLAAAVGVKLILADAIGSLKTNVAGAEVVLDACARHGTKALVASTSEVYGKAAKTPQRESDDVLLGPTCYSRWSYSVSKMLDEFLALAHHRQGLPVVVFRLFNTVGPRQTGRYGMVVPRFVTAALKGEPVPVYGDGRQSRCFLHVRDAVDALVRLERSPQAIGEVFNVGSTQPVTIGDLALRVLAAVEVRRYGAGLGSGEAPPEGRIRYVPYEEAFPGGGFEEIGYRLPDITKIRKATRWRPRRQLEEILQDVIEERSAALEELSDGAPVVALA